jgi:hypothetical protein
VIARAAVLAALIAGACASGSCGSSQHGPSEVVRGGAPITLVLPAADGGEVDFIRFRGRLVVVHVFATWSLSAQADVEQLDAVYAGNQVAVVGLAVDPMPATVVPPWQRGSGAHYPIALADEPTRTGASPFGPIDKVPTTFVLDRAGAIVRRHVGPLAQGTLTGWLRELQ